MPGGMIPKGVYRLSDQIMPRTSRGGPAFLRVIARERKAGLRAS
jgi:hypothetical protein